MIISENSTNFYNENENNDKNSILMIMSDKTSITMAVRISLFILFISNILIQGGPFSYTPFYHRALLKHENKLKCMLK